MNNDELLKMALRHLTPQQIADAIDEAKRRKALSDTQRQAPGPQQDSDSDKVSDPDSKILVSDVVNIEQLLSESTTDTFEDLSFDRRMLRELIDTQAQFQTKFGLPSQGPSFADLHKWWDGTSYSISNDWLYTDLMEIQCALVNRDGSEKSFRLKVSF